MDALGFRRLDWDKLMAHTVPSPYVPKVDGPGDCSNFDTYPEEPVKWFGDGKDKFDDTFEGF